MNGKNNMITRRIEKFKVPVYFYDVSRKAKKEGINLELLFKERENLDKNFKEFISNLVSKINLSSVYLNIETEKFKEIIKSSEYTPLPRNKVYSVTILTAGKDVEEYISYFSDEEKKLSTIAMEVYLKTAVKNLIDIINEEAKKENLEITEPIYIHSPFNEEKIIVIETPINILLEYVSSSKIGVEFLDGKIIPRYTLIFFVSWTLKKKK